MNTSAQSLVSILRPGQRRLIRSAFAAQIRKLSLHEYQTQEIFRQSGIAVPRGRLVESLSEAVDAAAEFGTKCLLKPQVLRPYRGSAASSTALATEGLGREAIIGSLDSTIFGTRLDDGLQASRVYVEEAVTDANEWSLEIGLDRERYQAALHLDRPSVRDSNETSAHQVYPLSVLNGVNSNSHADIAAQLGANGVQKEELRQTINKIFGIFVAKDALSLKATLSMPRSGTGVWCSGGRLTVDDAANKRQQDLFSQRDTDAEVPEEVEAEKYSLVYVKLPGNVGTVVNGAGLAMATNDAIAHHGGASANFLDTGGQATVETMTKAFGIILGDQRVKVILVNIYGGIIRCDMIAQSIISTARSLGPLRVPVVVRLQGTNSEEGLRLLEEADLGMHIESDFGRAASRAVQLAAGLSDEGTTRSSPSPLVQSSQDSS